VLSLDDLTGPALVVTFICNHCPYVQHVAAGLAALGRDLADQGVAMVGISSNDVVTYPQDGPDQMVAEDRHETRRGTSQLDKRTSPAWPCQSPSIGWFEKKAAKRSAEPFGFVWSAAWVASGSSRFSACGSHVRNVS
jgi:AhpC/TSA family protein